MFKPLSILLTILYGAAISHIHRVYPTQLTTGLVLLSFVLTDVVLLLVSFRSISVDEAVKVRLTSTLNVYRDRLSSRLVLSNNGVGAIFRMLIGLNFITFIPFLWMNRSSSSNGTVESIARPLIYLFSLGSLGSASLCLIMALTQPLMEVQFLPRPSEEGQEKGKEAGGRVSEEEAFPEIHDSQVPIRVLAPYLGRSRGDPEGWHKVGETNRKHDIHARVDISKGVYEIRTVWSEDHPSFTQARRGTAGTGDDNGPTAAFPPPTFAGSIGPMGGKLEDLR
ncbi:hypothetical protein IE53DRAFT_385024 [Violaceomyces palustris]|uniref:Uncharacterized protein n=1 Tax=Violaceomyces palustris TaxID=1673888 RepID=A0ACD0P3C6_9BASI|nr:hypothetical protein IE53DRAFT_385024 [Violaceomyces palustris]